MGGTLFEKLGGFATVSGIVADFYDKVLESRTLSGYFSDTDMRRLVDHQTKFICSLLGGPASFDDEQIRSIHARVSISDDAFREVTELFAEALEDAGAAPEDVDSVIKLLEAKRPIIVSA